MANDETKRLVDAYAQAVGYWWKEGPARRALDEHLAKLWAVVDEAYRLYDPRFGNRVTGWEPRLYAALRALQGGGE